jgi:integrase
MGIELPLGAERCYEFLQRTAHIHLSYHVDFIGIKSAYLESLPLRQFHGRTSSRSSEIWPCPQRYRLCDRLVSSAIVRYYPLNTDGYQDGYERMGTQLGKLTVLKAAALAKSKTHGYYGDGGGLYLQVTSGGASWVFRYKVPDARKRDGLRLREMGLGPWHTISLADARTAALAARQMRQAGRDPIEERQVARALAAEAAAKAVTFKQCAQRYIAAHRVGWRNSKHAAQWMATLTTYAYPHFGELPVQAVDVGLVLKAVEPIWSAKPETASRVRGRIESILDWATARGYRKGENPARWRGHLENLLPKKAKVRAVEHHAALPYVEVAGFLVELRKLEGVAARALELAILTATRTGEVIGARWDEVDVANRLWTIPGARMKAGKEYRVPLSNIALAVLKTMAELRHSDYVFPGSVADRPLSNMSMLMLLRRMGHGDLTTHGFRSTFADWCAERTAFPAEVREMALAHAVGDKVEAAYRRGDLFEKRRQLVDAWAAFCAQPQVGGSQNVVPISA